LLVPAFVYH